MRGWRLAWPQRPFPLMVRLSYHERSDGACERDTAWLRSPYEGLRASGSERLVQCPAQTTGCVITVGGGYEGFPR